MLLVHYTTQIFLESLGDSLISNPHDFLASCCLNYLHLDVFKEHFFGFDPFLQYSAQFWDRHLSAGSSPAHLKQQAMIFLDSVARVANALEALECDALYPVKEDSHGVHGYCGLHLLAYKGLDTWIDQYIAYRSTITSSINGSNSCFECPWTFAHGIDLLDRENPSWSRVLTKWRGNSGYMPVNCAIEAGHNSTAELLLHLNPEVLNDEYLGARITLNPLL